MLRRALRLLLLATLFAAAPVCAQHEPVDGTERAQRPRVGIALSGGAARGLAHIGVLQVLEEEGVPVDVVSGTSMGAVIGGLYAMGYRADQIEQIVEEIDLAAVFTGRRERGALRLEQRRLPSETVVSFPVEGTSVRLPSGLRTGQEAVAALNRLTWPAHAVHDLSTLPRPFAAVAVDLRAGEAVAIREGYLAEAMYASMSLPSALVPVRRGDRLYVDGGLIRNLPVDDAHDLGADVVIGVDVTGLVSEGELAPIGSEGDASVLDVLIQAAALGNRAGIREQRRQTTLLLEPDLDGLGRLQFDRAEEYIARGEAAARAHLPAIRALVERIGGPVPPPPASPTPESVEIGRIQVVGVPDGSAADRLVRDRLDLQLPRSLLPEDAAAAVDRVVGTGLFDRVSYRVLPGADDEPGLLLVRVVPQSVPDRLGVGLRYDEFYGPGLLLSLALKNRLRFGDTAALTARLGRQFEVRGSYFTRLGTGSSLTAGAEVGYASAPYDEYDSDEPDPDISPTRFRQRALGANVFGGLALTDAALVGLRLRVERQSTEAITVPSEEEEIYEVSDPYAPLLEETSGLPADPRSIPFIAGFDGVSFASTVLSASLFTEIDTRDRIAFPRSGLRIRAQAVGGFANADNQEYREAYREAFMEAYERFSVPEALLAGAADRSAERNRIRAEVFTDLRERVTDAAVTEFPGQSLAPYQRFVADIEAAAPAGPLTLFGRLAYAHGQGDGLPANAYVAVGGIHASVVYAESFFPLVGLRPQQLVGTRGYLGVLGLQTESGGIVFRGFVNAGNAYGEEDRLEDDDADEIDDDDDDGDDDDDDELFDLEGAAIGIGLEIGTRTMWGPASVIVGVTRADRTPRIGVNLGFAF